MCSWFAIILVLLYLLVGRTGDNIFGAEEEDIWSFARLLSSLC